MVGYFSTARIDKTVNAALSTMKKANLSEVIILSVFILGEQ